MLREAGDVVRARHDSPIGHVYRIMYIMPQEGTPVNGEGAARPRGSVRRNGVTHGNIACRRTHNQRLCRDLRCR